MAYPNGTLKKLSNNTYSSRYRDGKMPVINSFSGSITQGGTLTINGEFSAKRNGQLFTRIATPAQAGQELVPSYLASTADSWLGTGASLLSETTAGDQWKAGAGTPIITHETVSEFHFSLVFKAQFLNYGVSAEAPQLKFPRPMVFAGHEGAQSPILFWAETDSGATLFLDNGHKFNGGWQGSPSSCAFDKAGEQLRPLFNQWCRLTCYYKINSSGKKDGSVYICVKNLSTGELFFNDFSAGINCNDQRFTTSLTPFAEPRYYFDANGQQVPAGQFWLFFYKQESTVLNMFVDGLIANDSPESVWLINGTNVDTAMTGVSGKAVQLPQLSRTSSQITATVHMGNFVASDNIYAVVQNSNGKFCAPFLVRAAT